MTERWPSSSVLLQMRRWGLRTLPVLHQDRPLVTCSDNRSSLKAAALPCCVLHLVCAAGRGPCCIPCIVLGQKPNNAACSPTQIHRQRHSPRGELEVHVEAWCCLADWGKLPYMKLKSGRSRDVNFARGQNGEWREWRIFQKEGTMYPKALRWEQNDTWK